MSKLFGLIAAAVLLLVSDVMAGPLDEWTIVSTLGGVGTHIAFGNGVFVSGGGWVFTSRDGVNWQKTGDLTYGNPPHLHFIADISFVRDRFVAPTYRIIAGTFVVTSTDGFSWSGGAHVLGKLAKVAYANGTFVGAVSFTFGGDDPNASGILFSRDLSNWTRVYGPCTTSPPGTLCAEAAQNFSGVAADGNGRFVAVGMEIVTSTNGLNWTRQRSANLSKVSSGFGRFVAIGPNGAILTSLDGGLTWTAANSGTIASLYEITYAAGIFVVVGDSGTILTSPDGLSWTCRESGITNAITGVCFGQGRFFAVGSFPSFVLRSGKLPDAARFMPGQINFSNGTVHLGLESEAGAELEIEMSQDLSAWNTLMTITNVSGSHELDDRTAPGVASRFYRIKQRVPP